MLSTVCSQTTVLLLPYTVYVVRFDEVFVGKKGHQKFRTPFDCVSEREHADCRLSNRTT